MCNFLIRAAFWVLLRVIYVRTAIEIAKETTNNQGKKYNWVKHLQRQQFSFTKTSIESEVSLWLGRGRAYGVDAFLSSPDQAFFTIGFAQKNE